MNLGAPGSSKGRLRDAYIGETNRGGSLMIDARFWEQELLNCSVHPGKKERRNCVSRTFCGSGERTAEGKVRNKCGERKFYTTCAQRGGGAALTEGGNRGMGGGEK